MRFGEKIKRLMDQRKWGIEELAVKSGLSRATLYSVLSSKWHTEFNVRTIDHLATAFRMDSDVLCASKGVILHEQHLSHDSRVPAYLEPTPYMFSEDDVIKTPRANGATLRPGIAGLSDVMQWYTSLDDSGKRAVLAMMQQYLPSPPAAVEVTKYPQTKASAVAKIRSSQRARKAAS
jgi:transcriptional regulator with XRE-family HTH domain